MISHDEIQFKDVSFNTHVANFISHSHIAMHKKKPVGCLIYREIGSKQKSEKTNMICQYN